MLILASSSPARRQLLRRAGVRFRGVVPRVRELRGRGRGLRETVLSNAMRKARAVSRRFPEDWVLAADTMIEFEGRLYGKPRSKAQAAAWLSRLAGRAHRLATGVVLRKEKGARELQKVVFTQVRLRRLRAERIARVLRTPERLAGGYAIRRGRDPLVERIRGSFTNVVGLPMETVLPLLRRAARWDKIAQR